MRLLYGIFLAALVAIIFWAKLAPMPVETTPEANKPQEAIPTQPPVVETPSNFTKDYERAMNETERKVILVFTCEKCPSCNLLEKNLQKVDLEGFLVCVIDTASQKELVEKYKVMRLPTSVMIERGEETDRLKGFSKARYEAWLSEHK